MINKIVYTNEKGISIELNREGPLFLTSVKGFDGFESEIMSCRMFGQDGVNISDLILNERLLTLNCSMLVNSEFEREELKKHLFSSFNPKFIGNMEIVNDNNKIKRATNLFVTQTPIFEDDYKTTNELVDFQIHLTMPSPCFDDVNETNKEISTWIEGMPFKFSLPFRLKQRGPSIKNIVNEGHVDTPIKIFFKGPATTPTVTNKTTGEFIRVLRDLTSDETLIINTEFGNKTVEIERNGITTNAFNLIDLDSTFFNLQVGDNLIEYTVADELKPQSVQIRYRNRYLGI